jgi:light-regulated signal transduction histidine kinase (bacteriophytochrome)
LNLARIRREWTDRLERANQELEAFSYSVSHDLRAPLRHVCAFADLLQKHARPTLDDKGRHYLKLIAESTELMGQLIDDLLAYSRSGRTELRKIPVDLKAIVRDVRDSLQPDVADRNVDWIIRPLPEVHADPVALRQVMANLLANAVKYTRPRERAAIEVGSMTDASGGAVVFVRDNGVGFDGQYAGKLFGVFQRLHRPEEFEGTGIGLAIVRRIIHRHGGRIWAEGAVDGGATFSFLLPPSSEEHHSGPA